MEGVHRRVTEIVEREVLNLAPGKVGQSNRLGVLKENKHPGRNPDLAGADVKTSIEFSRARISPREWGVWWWRGPGEGTTGWEQRKQVQHQGETRQEISVLSKRGRIQSASYCVGEPSALL